MYHLLFSGEARELSEEVCRERELDRRFDTFRGAENFPDVS
jgi:hypothetical protein